MFVILTPIHINNVRPTAYAVRRTEPRLKVACSTACGGRTATRTDWPAASSSAAAPLAYKIK
ncbi:MAG: hypothetical protein A2W27_02745 [Deltaproteobacteria bacterium RBG_16_44_11]|nr:MAG: hypothetical protein A2W27_02745 [Deltaproteobacteria bacterium RBG_16_44_11]